LQKIKLLEDFEGKDGSNRFQIKKFSGSIATQSPLFQIVFPDPPKPSPFGLKFPCFL
jgi:hypothetical protein